MKQDWVVFREWLGRLNCTVCIAKMGGRSHTVKNLTRAIQTTVWQATQDLKIVHMQQTCPAIVKRKSGSKVD